MRIIILTALYSICALYFAPSSKAGYDEGIQAIVNENYAVALTEFEELAESGDRAGQYWLGIMYDYGVGVPQNYVEAMKWYELAANQGSAGAKIQLGDTYFFGKGTPQDDVRAHMWYNLAAAQGVKFAGRVRDRVSLRMGKEQITQAKSLASSWRPRSSEDVADAYARAKAKLEQKRFSLW